MTDIDCNGMESTKRTFDFRYRLRRRIAFTCLLAQIQLLVISKHAKRNLSKLIELAKSQSLNSTPHSASSRKTDSPERCPPIITVLTPETDSGSHFRLIVQKGL